jgi:hypothetical protein
MRPSALASPPPIDPRDHAIESRSWTSGEERFYLVCHDGRYYAWIARSGHDRVYEMPSAAAARSVLASEQAFSVLTTPFDECVVNVLVLDPGESSRIICRAAVVDGGDEGIWLATHRGGGEESYALAGFESLAGAVEAFAAHLTDAAERIEREGLTDYPSVVAAALRYRAALARTDAARATLGSLLRASQARLRADRAVSSVAHAVGVSREFMHRVLTSAEWTWPAPVRLTSALAQPAADAAPGTPGAAWTVTARFTVDAADDDEARAIVTSVLRQMEVSAVIESTAGEPGRPRTVTAGVDLSGLQVIVPGDAVTCLRYVVRNLPGVGWRSTAQHSARRGVWKWRRAGRMRDQDEVVGHPAIRAAEIRAALSLMSSGPRVLPSVTPVTPADNTGNTL